MEDKMQLEVGLNMMEMCYLLDETKLGRERQIRRFFALANISLSEPIYETMPWKFVEYIYLARFLLGVRCEKGNLSPKGIARFPKLGLEIPSSDEIWGEVAEVYCEDYYTKHLEYPSKKYVNGKVEKLKGFLGGELKFKGDKT